MNNKKDINSKKVEKADLNATISEYPKPLVISITNPINHCITKVPAKIKSLNDSLLKQYLQHFLAHFLIPIRCNNLHLVNLPNLIEFYYILIY